MRRSRIAVVGVVALGAAIGVGIAGFPSSGSDDAVRVVASSAADSGATSVPRVSAAEASTTTEAPTTTTNVVLRSPAELTVLVANASGVRGAAAALTAEVGAAGYVMADPIDATDNAATSEVNFVAGFDGEAGDLAARLGLPAASVAPMPDPPPVADLAGAQLVVVVGADRAG